MLELRKGNVNLRMTCILLTSRVEDEVFRGGGEDLKPHETHLDVKRVEDEVKVTRKDGAVFAAGRDWVGVPSVNLNCSKGHGGGIHIYILSR